MPNVEITNKCPCSSEDIRLNNGMIVVLKDKCGPAFTAFIVTSFRNSKTTSNPRWDDTGRYCSLVNLANGNIACEEPCSRETDKDRIICHLVANPCYRADHDLRVYKDVDLKVELGKSL